MRACTRCGATYATGVLFCPNDGAPTADVPTGIPTAPSTRPVAPANRPAALPLGPPPLANSSLPAARPAPRAPSPPSASRPPAGPTSPAPAPADPFIGKNVGNFRLSRRIGSGGMGAVYEGTHPIIGNRVAVKVLGGSMALDRDLVDRFFAEARTLNQVAHDNIVRVIDLGQHAEGFYYCVMELLEGDTLAGLLSRGRPELERALDLLAQACDALDAAHAKGIVHRDLKPANVMLVKHPKTGEELVKLVDFGIAKLATGSRATPTISGTVIGTPAYMSPEQAAGRVGEIDGRSDLYSLGLLAYELVTGHHPYEGRAVGELIVAQVTETPQPPSRVYPVPKRLDEAVMRLLRKRREERFPSAAAAGAEFRALLADLRSSAQPTVPELAPAPVAVRVPTPAAPVPVLPPAPPPPPPAPQRLPPAPEAPPLTLRREATLSPGQGVRLATRQPPKGQGVRPGFVLALLVAGALFGAALNGLLDLEPVVASIASTLGVAPATYGARRARPPVVDGTNAAFASSTAYASCRGPFDGLRRQPFPTDSAALPPALTDRLARHHALVACLQRARTEAPATARWAAPFLEGMADFEFAHALAKLPPPLVELAESLEVGETQKTRPFNAELFAVQARDRFADARPDAPEEQKGFIEGFFIEVDALRHRVRDAAAAPQKQETAEKPVP